MQGLGLVGVGESARVKSTKLVHRVSFCLKSECLHPRVIQSLRNGK